MSLEKGISRTGTVAGVLLGCFLSFIIIFLSVVGGAFNYYENKYNEKYVSTTWEDLEGYPKWKIENKVLAENAPSKLFYIYLPNVGIGLLATLAPFIFGFYAAKGVFGTLNWVIKGFKE